MCVLNFSSNWYLVGVEEYGKGILDDDEHIYDIYTREYDFNDSDVEFKSSQDLWDWYESQKSGSDKEDVDIYQLVEEFVKHHPHANFILDECPFLRGKCKYRTPFYFTLQHLYVKLFSFTILAFDYNLTHDPKLFSF